MGFSLPDGRISACQYKGSGIRERVGSLPLVMFKCRPCDQLMEELEKMSRVRGCWCVLVGDSEALAYLVVFCLGR